MSVFVVFRTGKVVKYNDGEEISVEGASYAIRTKGGSGLIARVPEEVVERIEFGPPCLILESRKHRGARYYEGKPFQRARRASR